MDPNLNIRETFEKAIIDGGIVEVGRDLTELAIDQIITNDVLQQAPVIKTLYAIYKTGIGIRDALFIKKILIFINETNNSTLHEKESYFKELSKDINEKRRLFDKLLITLDNLDDIEKSRLLGSVFIHVIKKNITLEEFYRISDGVNILILEDLLHFIYKNSSGKLNDEQRKKLVEYRTSRSAEYLNSNLIKAGFLVEEIELIAPGLHNKNYKLKRKSEVTRQANLLLDIIWEKNIYINQKSGKSVYDR